MKKFGLLVLGIILGALAMYFYYSQDVDSMTGPPTVTEPSGLIKPDKIKSMTQAYNERHQIITDSLFKNAETEDNRSSWYKLDDIENYLAYAKQQAIDNNHVMDGLRLYLGAYPAIDKDNPGLTTLLFVPTGYEKKSEGSFFSLQGGSGDLTGSDGLNKGGNGDPPSSNYPQ